MLGAIGESAVRTTIRAESDVAAVNKEIALLAMNQKVAQRSVEGALKSTGSGADTQADSKEEGGNYKIDSEGVYFEKYDKEGNVIFRTPPEKRPVDQHV